MQSAPLPVRQPTKFELIINQQTSSFPMGQCLVGAVKDAKGNIKLKSINQVRSVALFGAR
jgi:hypothetical protein